MHKRHNLWPSLLLLWAPLALALQSDAEQPVQLEADSASIDDAAGTRVFTGNVVLTQGSIRVSADRLVVKALDDQADQFHATGKPARFQQALDGRPGQLVKGHADRIEYDSNSQFLHLIGNAMLTQDGDTVRTDRITYNRVRSLITGGGSAQGKERVRMVIQSKKDTNN